MYNREAPFVKKHFNGGTSFLLGCERVLYLEVYSLLISKLKVE